MAGEKLELVLSARERQDIAAAHDAAEADLVATKGVYESLAALESRSDRTTIKAPIDGVIVSVGALSGNAVAKDALLIRVVNLKKLWVVGQAYENQLDALASALEDQTILSVLTDVFHTIHQPADQVNAEAPAAVRRLRAGGGGVGRVEGRSAVRNFLYSDPSL